MAFQIHPLASSMDIDSQSPLAAAGAGDASSSTATLGDRKIKRKLPSEEGIAAAESVLNTRAVLATASSFTQPTAWDSSSRAAPPASPTKAPKVQKRLEDFYYGGKWNFFQLNGPPGHAYEYEKIRDVQMHEHLVGITAETAEGIAEDLWEVSWDGKVPVLQFKERLSIADRSIQFPSKMEATFGPDRISVKRERQQSIVTLHKDSEENDIVLPFPYKLPTSVVLNKKWAAVAWGDGTFTVLGKDEFKDYQVDFTTEDKEPISFMLFDDDDGLLTLSKKGVVELWQLPNPYHGVSKGGRFNKAHLFRGPYDRTRIEEFVQVQGTINREGQLCFIGNQKYGNRIALHAISSLPPHLVSQYKDARPKEGSASVPTMSRTIASTFFPPASTFTTKILKENQELSARAAQVEAQSKKESEELRAFAAEAQADKQKAIKESIKQQAQHKKDLDQLHAMMKSQETSFTGKLNGALANIAELTKRTATSEQEKRALQDEILAARIQEQEFRKALSEIQRDVNQKTQQLAQVNASLEAASANHGLDPVTFEPLDEPYALTNCGHVMNQSTIINMRNQHNNVCPCCRAPAPPDKDLKLFIAK